MLNLVPAGGASLLSLVVCETMVLRKWRYMLIDKVVVASVGFLDV